MFNLIVIIAAGWIGEYGVCISHLIKLFLDFIVVCAVFVRKALRGFLLEGLIYLLMRGSVLQIQHRVQIKLHAQASRIICVLRGFLYGSFVVYLWASYRCIIVHASCRGKLTHKLSDINNSEFYRFRFQEQVLFYSTVSDY
jgi:hypothetical protein